MSQDITDQSFLDSIFPASRTDEFFDALFGGAEEGAYDIRLLYHAADDSRIQMAFELRQRPGKCLRCSLTYGLPEVFRRHPVLDVAQVARDIAAAYGWEHVHWTLGATEEESDSVHVIPFTVFRDA